MKKGMEVRRKVGQGKSTHHRVILVPVSLQHLKAIHDGVLPRTPHTAPFHQVTPLRCFCHTGCCRGSKIMTSIHVASMLHSFIS